jgi:hypothetical protein
MGSNTRMSSKAHRRYRVIAVSLRDQEANAADRITEILRQAGWPKANRSLVVREALLRLEDELSEKSGEEIFRYFVDRYARRAGQLPYGEKGNGLGKPTK